MNAHRSKKIRHAMTLIARNAGDQIKEACEAKLRMPNRFGEPQHRTISPRRQLKSMVIRERIA